MNRQQKHSRSTLKWKLMAIYAVMVIGTAVAVLFWIRLSFEQYVRQAECRRFSNAVVTALNIEAKNYYTSRDDVKLAGTIADLKRYNPELSAVFLSGPDGNIIGGASGIAQNMLDEIVLPGDNKWNSAVDKVTEVTVDGKKYMVASYKGEVDPYVIHFGFHSSLIKARAGDLTLKVALVVGMTTGIVLLLGATVLRIIARPYEKLARDAEKLSLGDLGIVLKRASKNEVGRVYTALSRLKESILYSMKHLDV